MAPQLPISAATNPILLWLFKHGLEDLDWGKHTLDQLTIALTIRGLASMIADRDAGEELQRIAEKTASELSESLPSSNPWIAASSQDPIPPKQIIISAAVLQRLAEFNPQLLGKIRTYGKEYVDDYCGTPPHIPPRPRVNPWDIIHTAAEIYETASALSDVKLKNCMLELASDMLERGTKAAAHKTERRVLRK
jgi:hypothetical protein